jgi:UDP-glucose 4-epimerase
LNPFWKDKKVVVLGGASMIGSELTRQLVDNGVGVVWVADDLSSGRREWLPKDVELIKCDLRDYGNALIAVQGADYVFQLAAAHGGRAFVDSHAVECWDNFDIDTTVFRACAHAGVEKVIYMSSACAYDTSTQQDTSVDFKLSESLIDWDKPIVADGAYGTQKGASERILGAYVKRGDFKGAAVRGFTVYGKHVSLTHFIGAAIARTYIQQNPLVVFGDGTQRRNWTYCPDTARGIMLAAEKLESGVVNIGTEESNTPNSVYHILWDIFGWRPSKIEYRPNELVGTANRIADATKAKEVLGWTPQYDIRRGLEETVDWFITTYSQEQTRQNFEQKLFER